MIAVLAGGVGAARLLMGMVQAIPPTEITAIVNTADDEVINGLHVSPDLDTITYTLAGAIDPTKGWGLGEESWSTMNALERYKTSRPEGSLAANTWFRLGDRDMATHLYRSTRLGEGADLTAVTQEIASSWGLAIRLVPMTNDRVATRLTLAANSFNPGQDQIEISFQEYFVLHRHSIPIASIRYEGASIALANPAAIDAIKQSERIVIAPSNPLLSIGPILELTELKQCLTTRRDDVVAVSPIVNGSAIKGPADHLLTELGCEASVVGIARLYCEFASTLVIDELDAALANKVERCGMKCFVTKTVMDSPEIAATLSRELLKSSF